MSKLPDGYTLQRVRRNDDLFYPRRLGCGLRPGALFMSEASATAACVADQQRRVDPGPITVRQCTAGWEALKAYARENGTDAYVAFAGSGGMPHVTMMERIYAAMQGAAEWALRCFGYGHTMSLKSRGVRLVEEALETAQACGCDPAMLHALIAHVYSRPVGDVKQEIGGVGLCVLVLSHAIGMSADKLEELELRRVLAKSPEHFAARNDAKNEAGFDASV